MDALNTAPIFRVFNIDFIRENLSFEDGSAEPILVLGVEDIARQEDLEAKKSRTDNACFETTV
ncbi:hypothetical protein VU05_03595 [Desulfobulbus sp. F1]|nr:hypothetical protein [Desulfobulbus sp. F1]